MAYKPRPKNFQAAGMKIKSITPAGTETERKVEQTPTGYKVDGTELSEKEFNIYRSGRSSKVDKVNKLLEEEDIQRQKRAFEEKVKEGKTFKDIQNEYLETERQKRIAEGTLQKLPDTAQEPEVVGNVPPVFPEDIQPKKKGFSIGPIPIASEGSLAMAGVAGSFLPGASSLSAEAFRSASVATKTAETTAASISLKTKVGGALFGVLGIPTSIVGLGKSTLTESDKILSEVDQQINQIQKMVEESGDYANGVKSFEENVAAARRAYTEVKKIADRDKLNFTKYKDTLVKFENFENNLAFRREQLLSAARNSQIAQIKGEYGL